MWRWRGTHSELDALRLLPSSAELHLFADKPSPVRPVPFWMHAIRVKHVPPAANSNSVRQTRPGVPKLVQIITLTRLPRLKLTALQSAILHAYNVNFNALIHSLRAALIYSPSSQFAEARRSQSPCKRARCSIAKRHLLVFRSRTAH